MSRAPVTASVERAASALTEGRLVVYPTETVYGIGAGFAATEALNRLLRLKGRPDGRGISLIVLDLTSAEGLLAQPLPEAARSLARAFWPGPLTIVLPAAYTVASAVVGPTGGIGLRCSSDPVCRELAQRFGQPFTATSANRTGSRPATSVDEAWAYFGPEIDCYLDGGSRAEATVSTVVEFRCGNAYLMRAGAIPAQALAGVITLTSSSTPDS